MSLDTRSMKNAILAIVVLEAVLSFITRAAISCHDVPYIHVVSSKKMVSGNMVGEVGAETPTPHHSLSILPHALRNLHFHQLPRQVRHISMTFESGRHRGSLYRSIGKRSVESKSTTCDPDPNDVCIAPAVYITAGALQNARHNTPSLPQIQKTR